MSSSLYWRPVKVEDENIGYLKDLLKARYWPDSDESRYVKLTPLDRKAWRDHNLFSVMSHTRVKTIYSEEGNYGATEKKTLYCHHNHSCDCVTFYDKNGDVVSMVFCSWESGNDLWDAMNRLWFPFKEEWGKELKEGVEYYKEIGE